jgi:uncharacterized protein (TIGR03435 family)
MRKLRYIVGVLSLVSLVMAQSVGSAYQFEVASIKPVRSADDTIYFRFHHGGVIGRGVSLAALITFAFENITEEEQIVNAPKWLFSEKFDIDAKPPGEEKDEATLTVEITRARLRALLAERCGLKAHNQTRESKGYALVIGKHGAGFLQSRLPDGSPNRPNTTVGPGQITGPTISMPYLANWLGRTLGAPVTNRTGLTGFYAINLTFTPESTTTRSIEERLDSQASEFVGPSLFTAVQKQLGLQLVPEKNTEVLLCIDHIERPSGN